MHFSVRLNFKLVGNNYQFYCKQMKMAIKVSTKFVCLFIHSRCNVSLKLAKDWERDCSEWKRKECLRNCCCTDATLHLLSIAPNYIGIEITLDLKLANKSGRLGERLQRVEKQRMFA